jgi:hypothetical protein
VTGLIRRDAAMACCVYGCACSAEIRKLIEAVPASVDPATDPIEAEYQEAAVAFAESVRSGENRDEAYDRFESARAAREAGGR